MVWRKTFPEGPSGDFYTDWQHPLADWATAKNQVTLQLEDPSIAPGTPPPAASADWGPRLTAVINEIEQTNPVVGGVIECYPEQKKISTTVTALSGKKGITIRSPVKTPSGIFTSRGYGAGFYLGANNITMFQHTGSGSVNHWGPAFENLVFSAEDFQASTAPLVLLQNVNNYSFYNCSFVYGTDQLKIDRRRDLYGGGADAAYGHLERLTFSHFTGSALYVPSAMFYAADLNFFGGSVGSWAVRLGGETAQCGFNKIKFDTGGGGLWNQGHVNNFFHITGEGAMIHLRQDKDTSVAWSGRMNRYYGLDTTYRNQAGEIGVDVTSNVSEFNVIYGYNRWGTLGSGGAEFNDANGLMMVVADQWIDGNGPVIKLPNRFAAPAAPSSGVILYSRGNVAYRIAAGGSETAI